MSRVSCRALALAAACLAGLLRPVHSQTPAAANPPPGALPPGVPESIIFDPQRAPLIVVRVSAH